MQYRAGSCRTPGQTLQQLPLQCGRWLRKPDRLFWVDDGQLIENQWSCLTRIHGQLGAISHMSGTLGLYTAQKHVQLTLNAYSMGIGKVAETFDIHATLRR